MESADSELLGRYRRGDVEALEVLVARYRRPLYGFILNMIPGGEDADEIFQEVWLRVIRKLDLYRDRNFRGWLMRIARNIVIDRARRRKPDIALEAVAPDEGPVRLAVPDERADPARRAEANNLGARLAAAVNTLPAEQKEVFVLRTQAGLSFREIATAQKVSINTALARMQYALTKLRLLMQEEYDDLQSGS